MAVGSSGIAIYTTDSGATWSDVSPTIINTTLTSVAYGGSSGVFMAVGSSGIAIYTINSGTSWTDVSPIDTPLDSVAYGGSSGVFMAVGSSGKAFYTTNSGANWSDVSPNNIDVSNVYFNTIVYNNGIYIVSGTYNGAGARSHNSLIITTNNNGKTWTEMNYPIVPGLTTISSIAYGNNKFVAVGDNYLTMVSVQPTIIGYRRLMINGI